MQRTAPYRPPLLRRPSAASSVNPTPGRCPFLGTPADPGTSLAFPSEANNCYRSRFPVPISSIHQESYCLSPDYERCPVYQQYATADEPAAAVVPLAAVAAVDSGIPPAGSRAGSGSSAAAPALAVGAAMALGASRPAAPVIPPLAPAAAAPALSPVFPLDEPDFPDFQPDFGPEPAPEPVRRAGVDGRTVLIGLLVLAFLVLAGWFLLNYLERSDADREASGTVVSLPTLMATADMRTVQSGIAVGAAAEQTATALAGTIGETGDLLPTPTAALPDDSAPGGDASGGEAGAGATGSASEDLDSVAATATALFSGAVATVECGAPEWWVLYVIQEGDTIESLAASRGVLPEEFIVANCLPGPELEAGQQVYLPPIGVIVLLPGEATPTLAPTATATRSLNLPTRRPVLFPTPTFPVVIVLPTRQPPVPEATDAPTRRPGPVQPTAAPPTATRPAVRPTATPPGFFPTATIPNPQATATAPNPFATASPPSGGATRTPPGIGDGTPTVTVTVQPTLTPPTP